MRKSIYLGTLAAAALVAWGLSWQVPARAGGTTWYADISPKVAGCFLAHCRVLPIQWCGTDTAPRVIWNVPWWDERVSQALFTFTMEGGLQSTTTDDFGGNSADGNVLFGPFHGTWKQTGARAVSFTRLGFGFAPNGEHDFTWKIVGDVTWLDGDFEEARGTYFILAFYPDQDPLDPDEEPFEAFEGTMFLTRINHE